LTSSVKATSSPDGFLMKPRQVPTGSDEVCLQAIRQNVATRIAIEDLSKPAQAGSTKLREKIINSTLFPLSEPIA